MIPGEFNYFAPATLQEAISLLTEHSSGKISAVAIQLTLNSSTCSAAHIGLTNVSPVPIRAKNAEQALIGKQLTDAVIEAAGQAAAPSATHRLICAAALTTNATSPVS